MRVLLVKLTSMGDIFHTLPAVSEMVAHCPDLTIDWLVDEQFAEIPKWSRHVNRVFTVSLRNSKKNNKFSSFSAIRASLKQVKKNAYDLVIDAQGLLKSAILTRFVSAKQRHGYDKHSIREAIASRFYTHRHTVEFEQHAITRMRQLFAAVFGYTVDLNQPLDYGLSISTLFQCKDQEIVLCFPCTTWETKHWPKAYWRELFGLLDNGSCRIQLAWGSSPEQDYVRELAKGFAHVELLPSTTITQMMEYVRAASIVIGVDTGFSHLPQMFDIPLVAIYGATAPGKTGPMAKHQNILSTNFSCSPCFKRECQFNGQSIQKPACYETAC